MKTASTMRAHRAGLVPSPLFDRGGRKLSDSTDGLPFIGSTLS